MQPSLSSPVPESVRRRIEESLDLNERLLWIGRPVPTGRMEGRLATLLVGLLFCGFPGTVFVQGLLELVGKAMAAPEIQAFLLSRDFWGAIGMEAFLSVFLVIGAGLLFAPVWQRIGMRRWVYVLTDRRAILKRPFATRSWRVTEWIALDRADHRDGTTDVLFAWGQATGSQHPGPIGFPNLPSREADALFPLLRRVAKTFEEAEED